MSLELFQTGKTISAIAKERELAETTIFSHLSKFVDSGEVKVTDCQFYSSILIRSIVINF
jgi:hypothetical protein